MKKHQSKLIVLFGVFLCVVANMGNAQGESSKLDQLIYDAYFGSNAKTDGMVIPLKLSPAKNNGGTPWYAELEIGLSKDTNGKAPTIKGQTMKFMMDTGTSNFWVTSDLCINAGCAAHNAYNASASSTYIQPQDTKEYNQQLGAWGQFSFFYGIDDFLFSYKVFSDQNNFKCFKEQTYYANVKHVQFQRASVLKDGTDDSRPVFYVKNINGTLVYKAGAPMPDRNKNWDQMICDGGLAIPYQKNTGVASDLFLDKLVDQGYITNQDKMVAFWTDQELKRGEVTIGGYRPELIDETSLRWLQVDIEQSKQVGGWLTNLYTSPEKDNDFLVNGVSVFSGFAKSFQEAWVMFDTGSSRFKGDPAIIDQIKCAITSGAHCGRERIRIKQEDFENTIDLFPTITVRLSGEDFSLTPRQYFVRFVEYDQNNTGHVFWELALNELDGMPGTVIVGSVFLDHYYSIYQYDPANPGNADLIGIAKYN
ncbi:MAG: A1 family peptidase [Desulfobacterales bacterium]|nr:A1 family peptidase [Desulfobacterales bacterium]